MGSKIALIAGVIFMLIAPQTLLAKCKVEDAIEVLRKVFSESPVSITLPRDTYRGTVHPPFNASPVVGTIEEIPITPEYKLITVTDDLGRVRVYDSSLATTSRATTSRENLPEDRISKRTDSIFSTVLEEPVLDAKAFKKAFCAQLRSLKNLHEFSKMSRTAEALDINLRISRLATMNSRCLKTSAIIFPSIIIDRISAHARETGVRNWWTEHQSNFTIGVAAMAFFRNCVLISHFNENAALAGTLATNLAANIYYEIDVSDGNQTDHGTTIHTDLGDFTSGSAAIVTYLALVKLMEKRLLHQGVKNYCGNSD